MLKATSQKPSKIVTCVLEEFTHASSIATKNGSSHFHIRSLLLREERNIGSPHLIELNGNLNNRQSIPSQHNVKKHFVIY